MEKITFNVSEAQHVANELGIDFSKFSIEEFYAGMNVEAEHGAWDPQTNVTNNNPILTGKIAWAHLKEFPDYYTRLKKMEKEADVFWGTK
jgi:hypothetical protein